MYNLPMCNLKLWTKLKSLKRYKRSIAHYNIFRLVNGHTNGRNKDKRQSQIIAEETRSVNICTDGRTDERTDGIPYVTLGLLTITKYSITQIMYLDIIIQHTASFDL